MTAWAQNNADAPIIFTVAGGTFGDGGPATNIGIGDANSLVTDTKGNLYFIDDANYLIRKVDSNGILSTVAGNGIPAGFPDCCDYPFDSSSTMNVGNSGDGGPATSAEIGFLYQLQMDSHGNLFFFDYNARIRKIDTHGIITTIVGNGTSGFSGDGGPATAAEIGNNDTFTLDSKGNIYVLSFGSNQNCCSAGVRIRKVDSSGIINTIAGNGVAGSSGDGGPAINAEIAATYGLSLDGNNNIYFVNQLYTCNNGCTTGDLRVRKLDTNGVITTVAGNGMVGYTGDGGPATNAAINTYTVLADRTGNLYIWGSDRIRKVGTNGIISTVAGNGTAGNTGDGGPATNAEIDVAGFSLDAGGDLFLLNETYGPCNPVCPTVDLRIRKVSTNGIISTYAGNGSPGFSGDGGVATSAQINGGIDVIDGAGNTYIVNRDSDSFDGVRIRRVDTNNIITTIAGNGSMGFNGDGNVATNTEIDNPAGLATDSSGNLFIGDYNNFRIRKLSASGSLNTIAGNGTDGCLEDSTPSSCNAPAYQGAAINAQLESALAIGLDGGDNLYFSQENNCYIAKLDVNGDLSVLAGTLTECGFSGDGGLATSAELNFPLAVAVDSANNVYIGDTNNFLVRRVDTQGVITTAAGNGTQGYSGDGGPATNAEIGHPSGIAIDSTGNVYIGDTDNFRVRKVDTKGVITTVAGTGIAGFSGDGGPATSAQITGVNGLAIDKSGNLYISDPFNNRVRRVDPNGVITTYVGNGSIGYSGDGGPATDAMLTFPGALAVDSNGDLYVGDVFNYRVRVVEAAFTLALNPTGITIASPGESGTTSLAVTPGSRFTGNVSLTCSVAYAGTGSATKPPTCSLNSSMLAISGPGSLTSTLTVNTTAAQTSMLEINGSRVTLALIGFLIIPCWRRRRALMLCLVLLCVITICVAPIGCGGGGGNGGGGSGGGGTTTPGTTTGSYNVTITATSGSFTSSIVVPVTVQ